MSIPESILIALFVMAVVFAVLGILWTIIKILTIVIQRIERRAVINSKK